MKLQKMIFWLIPIMIILIAVTIPLLPVFNIKTISIETEYRALADELAAESGLKTGSNMFLTLLGKGNIFVMRFTEAEKRLKEKFTHLGNIRVHANLPSSVIIEYDSREPVFEIEYGDKYLIADINGCVLSSAESHSIGFLRVTGVDIDGFALGCILGDNDDRFRYASEIYTEIQKFDRTNLTAFREYIEWIDLSNPVGIALMYDDRILIKLDSRGDISYQTAYMCGILSENIRYSERGTLDFTTGENPVFSPE